MLEVTIIQRRLAHYRLPLYDKIIANNPDISLRLYCGLPERSAGGSGIPLAADPPYVKRFKTYSLNLRKQPLLAQPGIVRQLLRARCDVLVCEGTPKLLTTIFLLILRRLAGAKNVLWLKAWPHASAEGKLKRRLRTAFLRLADAYIVYGHESKKRLLSYGVACNRITIAQNTVETAHLFEPKNERARPHVVGHPVVRKIFAQRRPYIFNIGRHIREKRVEDLLHAFAILQADKRYKEFELVIAGAGPETETLKKIAPELNLEKAHFVGVVSDAVADALFLRSTCCVFPGAVGLALNQAMACGKPVCCADEPGPDSELLLHRFNGLRYQRGNITELVDCLKTVLRDPGLQKSLGAKARATIKRTATMENMARQYAAALRSAAETDCTSSDKPKVLILGKLPPPYYGPAVATEILLKSNLRAHYSLCHLNTGVHESLSTLGSWSWRRAIKNIGLYVQFVSLLLKRRPDLVLILLSQSTPAFVRDSIFILLSRLFSRRTLLQLRGSNFKNVLQRTWPPMRAYAAFVLRRAQGVIVLGNKLRHLFAEYFSQDQIFVVPNGADYDVRRLEKDGGVLRILHLANLQSSKGIEDVLDAVLILKNNYKMPFHLDVIGAWRDESTKSKCLKLVEEHDLPVTFHPPAGPKEKFEFLANAGVFVFTPREPEGHPWVIVEALAAGLPIIATDQGAITESVIDGVNGFIVETKNPRRIAEKIMILIKNPDLRKRMGTASRRHYFENFTEAKMVQRLRLCFDAILYGKREIKIQSTSSLAGLISLRPRIENAH